MKTSLERMDYANNWKRREIIIIDGFGSRLKIVFWNNLFSQKSRNQGPQFKEERTAESINNSKLEEQFILLAAYSELWIAVIHIKWN